VLRGELDAGLATRRGGEEVHRQAEQQRKQHHRRAIVVGEEARRRAVQTLQIRMPAEMIRVRLKRSARNAT
jgi:hypothetical protein